MDVWFIDAMNIEMEINDFSIQSARADHSKWQDEDRERN